MEGDCTDCLRMALLWRHLPAGSRCARRQNPELEWGTEAYILRQIEFTLRNLTWALNYDKKHPTPKPEPLPTPGTMAEANRRRRHALAAKEEITRALGLEGMVDG